MSTDDSRIEALLAVMAALRDPDGGCPWDLEQDFASIAPYTIEEAYEVADAIARGDMGELREELGDLLLQVVFHARMAEEEGHFAFPDVVRAVTQKMRRRHPHVFGGTEMADAAAQTAAWEVLKAEERAARGPAGLLDGVPAALPALLRALKLQKRAAQAGFDWPETTQILDKLREEVDEVSEAVEAADPDRIEDEIGDVLFVIANVARRLGVDPEAALRRTNAKFERRFRAVEAAAAVHGAVVADLPLETLEGFWAEAKKTERTVS